MRGLLLLAFIAVSTDAIKNDGAITQAVWQQVSTQVVAQIVQINDRVQQSHVLPPRGNFAQR